MNAQEIWKGAFTRARRREYSLNNISAQEWRDRFRREAALERTIARLQRELAAAERTITTLQDRVWQLEAQEHNRDDGNEWEKEYYLRGMHR